MTNQRRQVLYGAAQDLFDLLTKLRADKPSLSLRQIAARTGMSAGYLSEILAGRKTPKPDKAERLALTLGANARETGAARHLAERAQLEPAQPVAEPDAPYRLQSMTSGAAPPPSGTSPSRLLSTAGAVVPFFGRDAELLTLTEWRDDPDCATGALLVHGSGGQGKTRLSQKFAAQCPGWAVVQARHRTEPAPRVRQVSRSRLSSATGVLVVVDYAERWPAEDLLVLAQDQRLHGGGPLRLLLIARPAGAWWEVTRTRLRRLGLTVGQMELPPLALSPEQRREAFIAARDAFAAELGVEATPVDVPAHVGGETFAHALSLHMAALVAVDAHARGERSPADPLALSAYLLDRERDYWHSMHEKPGHPLRTPPAKFARAVFTATACGPRTYDDGLVLLRAAGVSDQGTEVLDDHSVVYPPPDDGSVLAPLAPDRLGEDFLALQTPGHGLPEYRGDPWAATAVERLLLGAASEAVRPPHPARRAITVLIEAAHRWPHLVHTHLNPVLRQAPHLLLMAGNAAMIRFADLQDIDMSVCEAVEDLLMSQRHIGLDSGIAALVRALTEWRTAESPDVTNRAHQMINLGWRLAMAGRFQEALSATEQAVDLLRSLPADAHADQAPALAASLRNLGVWLANVGRDEEALRTCREASEVFGRLAASDFDRYQGDYATALSNEALRLSRLGRHDAAIDTARRAVDLHREYTEHHALHAPYFASGLNNLAGMLRERDVAQAVRLAVEAVEVARNAALLQPAAHTPTLAAALNTASGVLTEAGRHDDAVASAEEAVALYKLSAAANPDAFGLKLVTALGNMNAALGLAGRTDEALSAVAEAVATCRQVLDANPSAYDAQVSLPHLLYRLARCHAEAGHTDAGLDAAMEAARLTLDEEGPDLLEQAVPLAQLLGSLAAKTATQGHSEEALPANVARAEILRRLAAHDPAAHEAEFAVALVNLGARSVNLGDTDAAIRVFDEAAQIRRRLYDADPATHRATLRSVLYNLAATYAHAERWTETVEAAATALGLGADGLADDDLGFSFVHLLATAYAALFEESGQETAMRALELAAPLIEACAARDEDRFMGSYLGILSALMVARWRAGDREAALDAGARAVEFHRKWRESSAPVDTRLAATTLLGYGVRLREMNRNTEAVLVLREAVAAFREYGQGDAGEAESRLADALHELAKAEISTDSDVSATLQQLTEAMEIRMRLVPQAPDEHVPELAALVRTAADAADNAGLHELAEEFRAQLSDTLGMEG